MRILQVAHAMTKYDGASKFVLALDRIFRELGYVSEVYAHKVDPRLADCVKPMDAFHGTAEDLLIYQMTTGTSFNKWVYQYPHKIVLYYHNITPAKFFFGNAWGSWFKCITGRRDLKKIVRNTFFAWGASDYSCQELRSLGLQQVKTLPAIVEPSNFLQQEVLPSLYERYHDQRTNILVVGRGVPHKKQDEAIDVLRYYKEHLSVDVRLFIVGNIKKSFAKKLHAMVERYHLQEDVIFTGMVTQEELCTYYQLSDALLSLSEHEGFCVPLVESMIFGKPVFAYGCAAVPETLGQGGMLLPDKDIGKIAETIYNTLQDAALLKQMRLAQKKRLQELSYAHIKQQVASDMKQIIGLWKENH